MTTFDGTWRTSTRSASQGQCVEVALTPEAVGVRDTKNRHAGHVEVSPSEWNTFVGSLKAGAFDL